MKLEEDVVRREVELFIRHHWGNEKIIKMVRRHHNELLRFYVEKYVQTHKGGGMRRKNGLWYLRINGVELVYTDFIQALEVYWYYVKEEL